MIHFPLNHFQTTLTPVISNCGSLFENILIQTTDSLEFAVKFIINLL